MGHDRRIRHARAAVFALFFTNGALFANIIPRYPEIKDIFELSDPVYGLTVALFPLGAICSGPVVAAILRRFSSAKAAVAGTFGIGLFLTLAGVVTVLRQVVVADTATWMSLLTYVGFAAFFFIAGTFDSLTDVGQNAHGLRVQRLMGKSIINSFHAGWSLGAMSGGLMAAAAIALGLPLGVHLALAAAIMGIVAIVAWRFTLPGMDPAVGEVDPIVAGDTDVAMAQFEEGDEHRVYSLPLNAWLVVAFLTILSIAGMLVEDANSTWSTLYLRDHLGVAASLAGLGFVVFLASQTIGRFTADALTEVFGPARTIQLGAAVIGVGMCVALVFPGFVTTLLGLACAGFGCASIVPLSMNAADDVPGLAPGTGLTVVTWLGRLAFLCAPPLVGIVVERTSLASALWCMPIAAVAIALSSLIIVNGKALQR